MCLVMLFLGGYEVELILIIMLFLEGLFFVVKLYEYDENLFLDMLWCLNYFLNEEYILNVVINGDCE